MVDLARPDPAVYVRIIIILPHRINSFLMTPLYLRAHAVSLGPMVYHTVGGPVPQMRISW